ncbi:MAG: hypothetical protein N2234_08175 [Planctomycetota bacterium]|nr:hypothetical protein [Planctomycetota bacterium]
MNAVELQGALRDGWFVLEGKIDNDNLYYEISNNTLSRIPLSIEKFQDFPTPTNGIYGKKLILDRDEKYGGSFYTDVWENVLTRLQNNHIYSIAMAKGEINETVQETWKGTNKGKISKVTISVKKPENYKLLYILPRKVNGIIMGAEYTTKEARGAIPFCFPNFTMSKYIKNRYTYVNPYWHKVRDSVLSTDVDYMLSFNNLDAVDEYIYLSVELTLAYEILL